MSMHHRPSATRRPQRGRALAMTRDELDEFLCTERTCRVATVDSSGRPHVVPLWFAWDGDSLWLSSLVRSQRWTDLERDPRVAVVVDAGDEFGELRGVELLGTARPVGEVPRRGAIAHPDLATPELLFARKYTGKDEPTYDGRHAWLRLAPEKITSWDFRKRTQR